MKRLVLAAALVLLAACSRKDVLREQVDQQSVQLRDLEQKLSQTEQMLRAEIEKKSAQVERNTQHAVDQLQIQVQRNLTDLEKSQAQLDRKIGILERRPQTAQTEPIPASASTAQALASTAPSAPKMPVVSFYSTPDPAADDFVVPPMGPDADLFPIRITQVTRNRVVTGKIKTSRFVDTGKIEKDDFGDASPIMKREELTADEYGYQVSCAIENLTKTPKKVSLSAGGATTAIVVLPAQIITNVLINAAMGAGLSVEAGGYVRTYPITY